MASCNIPRYKRQCNLCSEELPILILTPCQHAYCLACLDIHLKTLTEANQNEGIFPCPDCQKNCPLPGRSHRLASVAATAVRGETDADATLSTQPMSASDGTNKMSHCSLCLYIKNAESSDNQVGIDCCYMYLCEECASFHPRMVAAGQRLLRIGFPKTETKQHFGSCNHEGCTRPDRGEEKFCCTCSTTVCSLCVQNEHNGHSLKRITEVFKETIIIIGVKKAIQEKRLSYTRMVATDLDVLKSTAGGWKDQLMIAVENHTDKGVSQAQQKPEMIASINAHFEVLADVLQQSDTISSVVNQLDASISKADDILLSPDSSSSGVMKLVSLCHEIDEVGKLVDEIGVDDFQKIGEQLCQSLKDFVRNSPLDLKEDIFMLRSKPTASVQNVRDFRRGSDIPIEPEVTVLKPKLSFNNYKDVEPSKPFLLIRSITILTDEFFAVAQPAEYDEPFHGIDIYKFPAIFQQSFREFVSPGYDSASTPDGNLAILSDGKTPNTLSVRHFKPRIGFIGSTEDLPVKDPLSFDVNERHQYFILSKGDEDNNWQVVYAFNYDGSLILKHNLGTDMFGGNIYAMKIACSPGYLFLSSFSNFDVFQVKASKLIPVMSRNDGNPRYKHDLTDLVTSSDKVAFCYIDHYCNSPFVVHARHVNNQLVDRRIYRIGLMEVSKGFLSFNDNYLVVSLDDKFMVFSLHCDAPCEAAGQQTRRLNACRK